MMQVFDKNSGAYVRQFGSVGRARGQLQNPYGVAVDGTFETLRILNIVYMDTFETFRILNIVYMNI